VRDLPIAGRVTYLVWRKRRYRCAGCGHTFTEYPPELPARQRVTRRFRRRLFARVRGGATHAKVRRWERTTRYQVQRAFRAGWGRVRRAPRGAAGAAAVARRGPAPPRPGARYGRLRPRPRARRGRARRALTAAGGALPALAARRAKLRNPVYDTVSHRSRKRTSHLRWPSRASAKTAFGPV
jgi:hypothetical protein